jgi:sulfate transport system ATP-binding protein
MHDQDEAFAIADRGLIISAGKLEQAGTPVEILDEPATEFVARFVGDVNVLPGLVRDGRIRVGQVEAGEARAFFEGTGMHVVVRAYDLKFWKEEAGPATVRRVMTLGDRVRVEAWLDETDAPIFAQFPRRSSLLHGLEAWVRIAVELTHARAWESGGRP